LEEVRKKYPEYRMFIADGFDIYKEVKDGN
jgi:hypothetical protein